MNEFDSVNQIDGDVHISCYDLIEGDITVVVPSKDILLLLQTVLTAIRLHRGPNEQAVARKLCNAALVRYYHK